jgi:glucose/arabinose dehydrogenase
LPSQQRLQTKTNLMKTTYLHYIRRAAQASVLAAANLQAANTNLPAAADAFINSGAPDNNAGANAWFDAGTDGTGSVRRGLIRFELSAVPPGSVITSAVVQLTVIKVPGFGAVSSTFDLFRLTSGWSEGAQSGSSGASALAGESSWNARMESLLGWSAAGADSDRAAAASASTAVGASSGTAYSWTSPGIVADVQFWVDHPSLNAGWLLKSESESTFRSVRGFAARENGSGAGTLQVGYTPPPSPQAALITSLTLSNKFPSPPLTTATVPVLTNGLATLQWRGDTNGAFDVLYATNLQTGVIWSLAQANITGSITDTNTLTDPPYLASPAYAPNRNLFYRVNSRPQPTPGMAVRLVVVASNLVSPTVLTHAHDGSGRLFIADQTGQIRIVDSTGALLPVPFLDIAARMVALRTSYDERGLLGLAFHPGYSTNGRFFIYYAAPPSGASFDNKTILSEFKVSATNANVADATSERVLLTIDEPEFNHEGADVVFGPDGYLYLGPGDGGGAGDQHGAYGNAQSLTNLLGKILRLDVDSGTPYTIPSDNPFIGAPGARPEIYAFGLRNPWRFSFDRGGTRQGFIADVGQNLWEEINLLRKGANYGWRVMEGNHVFDPTIVAGLGVDVARLDSPIHEYGHGASGISIIGGFVHRGPSYPDLNGAYVFGDFSTSFGTPDGQLYYLTLTRPGIWERFTFQLYPGGNRLGRFIKGFGEDEAGDVYVLSTTVLGPTGATGDVRKLVRP